MSDFGNVELQCDKCGGTVFMLPPNPAESDRVVCHDCGHDQCSVGDWRDANIERAKAMGGSLAAMMRDAAKRG